MWAERSISYRDRERQSVTVSRGSSDPLSRWSARLVLVSLLSAASAWALPASQVAHGSEFRFVVQDLADNTAAWLPTEVVIHTQTDFTGGLIFILVNPTARTHVFLVEGLYEQVASENGEPAAKPLKVTVAPEETIRAILDTEQFKGSQARGQVEEFRFFCPLHRADVDPGGTIRIVHLGGTIRLAQ